MTKKLLTILFCMMFIPVFSQNVGISDASFTPDASAMLEVKAIGKGMLIPRMVWASKPATPADGLLIYSTDGDGTNGAGFYYYNGTLWVKVGTGILTGSGGADHIAYWNGTNTISYDNNQLYWDATNNRMGLGTPTTQTGYKITTSTGGLWADCGNSSYDAIRAQHTSGAGGTTYGAIRGELTDATYTTVNAYLAFHSSTNSRFGIYVGSGDYGGWFAKPVGIGASVPATTDDLEIRNTTGGNPVNMFLRQSASNTVSGTVIANIKFGDNYTLNPQAQISITRGATSTDATDLPTDMIFSTTPDASITLTERMRILNSGQFAIGTSTPSATAFTQISPAVGFNNGIYIVMPANTITSQGINVINNNVGGTGNKTGVRASVGGNDGTASSKVAFTGVTTGDAGTFWGGSFSSSGSGTGVINYGINAAADGSTPTVSNYGVRGYVNNNATNNYAIYGEVGVSPGTNNYSGYFKGGAIGIEQIGTTPSNPAASTEVKTYVKTTGGNVFFVIQFNDAGTIKYRYIQLNSTNATWTYSTTAP